MSDTIISLLANRTVFASKLVAADPDYVIRRDTSDTANLRKLLDLNRVDTDMLLAFFVSLMHAAPDLLPSIPREHNNTLTQKVFRQESMPRVEGARLVPTADEAAVVARVSYEWPIATTLVIDRLDSFPRVTCGKRQQEVMVRGDGALRRVIWPEWTGIQGDLLCDSEDVTQVTIHHRPVLMQLEQLGVLLTESPSWVALATHYDTLREFLHATPVRKASLAAATLCMATAELPPAS